MESTPPASPPHSRRDSLNRNELDESSGWSPLRWFVVSMALLAVAVGGWFYKGQGYYGRWRDDRLLDRAEALLKEGKLSAASVAARKIYTANETNPRAISILADIAEQVGVRDAVLWRQRAAQVDPGRLEYALAWAKTALQFQENDLARAALERVGVEQRDTLGFHEMAALVDFATGRQVEAEKHFERAAALAPGDETKLLNLARVRIFSADAAKRAEARKQLLGVPESSTNHPGAQSLLVTDAVQLGDLGTARRIASKLCAGTNATVADRTTYLGILQRTDLPAFTNEMVRLRTDYLKRPADLTALVTWLNLAGYASTTLAWVRTLPPDSFSSPGPGMAVAELYIAVKDWLGLRAWVLGADWDIFQAFRYGYDAYAVHNLSKDENSKGIVAGLWAKAIDEASKHPNVLQLLADAAQRWGLPEQHEQTLWAVVETPTNSDKALAVLNLIYTQRENTLGLYRVSRKLLEKNPTNLAAKNNVIWLGFLLKLEKPEIYKMAQDLSNQAAGNGIYVSTVAYAFHRQNRTREGLDKLAALEPAELDRPGVALVYGYLLARSGDRQLARTYLRKAERGPLLPEEIRLLDEARDLVR